jgi:uncharacterized protein YdaU (DUF1376 family)
MHYYKFNISDWHLATSHLSLEEEAVYFKLVNFYYDSEKPIPLETKSVIRRLRLGNYTAMVDSVLDEFFVPQADGWHHNRCDDEIQKYHHKAEVNQKVGKLGGRPKKINDLDNNPKITQSVSIDNPQKTLTTNQEPLTKNHIKTTPKVVTPEGVSDDLWNDFLVYRKRLKAPVTDRVLARLVKEAELAKMPLDQVLETIIFKGWRSFDATWITQAAQKATEMPLGTEKQIEEAYRVECGGNPTTARFNSYFEMKKFILDFRDKKRKVA